GVLGWPGHRNPLAWYHSAVRRAPSRKLTCGRNPRTRSAFSLEKLNDLRKKSSRRRCSGGFSPSGLKVDSNTIAASRNGHNGARIARLPLATASLTADTISLVVIFSAPASTTVSLLAAGTVHAA